MTTDMTRRSEAVEAFETWLAQLTREGEFAQVSPARRYAHEEGNYDAQYGTDTEQASLLEGMGAIELLREYHPDMSGPLMEIGCGTGLLSVGMVAAGAYPRVLLTDPSPSFLGIARQMLRRREVNDDVVRYAVVMGEDFGLLPERMFSAIVMRSTLHHIIDVEAFISAAGRALRPGGLLMCQEPIAEGFSLMGAIAAFFPLVAAEAGMPLTDMQRQQLVLFQDTMQFMARRDMDKSQAEDKHLFRPAEIMRLADAAGMSADFRPNADVRHFAPGIERPGVGVYSFSHMFKDYLKYCMNFGESFTPLFQGPLVPYLSRLEHLSRHGAAPTTTGIFVCQKRP